SGVAGNWQWWAFLLTGMATVFFYARLWRRSNVLTDLEFYEIRYSGRPAVFVRGFRAIYLGLFFNCVIMATVNLAAVKIAMAGSVAAAWFALRQPEVGGLTELFRRVPPSSLNLLPDFSDWGLTLTVLIIPLTVQWWSVWYPGAEPGGGSYIAQRMLASKSESDALEGTLFFNV